MNQCKFDYQSKILDENNWDLKNLMKIIRDSIFMYFFDFHIFDINSGNTKTGFRIKVEITPKQDSSGATPVFSGTNWKVTEMLSGGSGYAVNDTFALSNRHHVCSKI